MCSFPTKGVEPWVCQCSKGRVRSNRTVLRGSSETACVQRRQVEPKARVLRSEGKREPSPALGKASTNGEIGGSDVSCTSGVALQESCDASESESASWEVRVDSTSLQFTSPCSVCLHTRQLCRPHASQEKRLVFSRETDILIFGIHAHCGQGIGRAHV